MRLRTTVFVHFSAALCLVLAGLAVAWPLSAAIEVQLSSVPEAPAPTGRSAMAERRVDEARLRLLLGLTRPLAPPPSASLPPFAGRLLGTLSSQAPRRSMASLALPSGHVQSVWEGDQVLDAEILSIERGAIVVRRNGVQERLGLRSIPTTPAALPFVTPVSVNDYRVSRAEVLRRMSDLYALSRDVRVVPAFRDGQPIGFRFAGIAAESPVARLGLQSGDVIRAVNGQPMESVQQVLSLAAALERVPEVQLELERDGRRPTHRYRLD